VTGVEIRAFRGTRRSSVYRGHVVTEDEFRRIAAAAARRGLALLPTLEPSETHELDKREARTLAAETTSLRVSGELPELDDDLTEIAEVARWCARASEHAWLRIEGS
jgi:hypothetical protein